MKTVSFIKNTQTVNQWLIIFYKEYCFSKKFRKNELKKKKTFPSPLFIDSNYTYSHIVRRFLYTHTHFIIIISSILKMYKHNSCTRLLQCKQMTRPMEYDNKHQTKAAEGQKTSDRFAWWRGDKIKIFQMFYSVNTAIYEFKLRSITMGIVLTGFHVIRILK